MKPEKFKFDFSISYAEPQQSIAEELSNALYLKGYIVFFDKWNEASLWGKRLDQEFLWIYGSGTKFFLPIISRDYVERDYPQFEWETAKREAEKRKYEFILPLRYDDAMLLGLSDKIGYIDLRNYDIQDVVSFLCKKFNNVFANVVRYADIKKWVATFGVIIENVLSNENLPGDVSINYPYLCDWLEKDLIDRVKKAGFYDADFPEASFRNGETLSVRISFTWDPAQSALTFGDLAWWEVLEVVDYDELYKQE